AKKQNILIEIEFVEKRRELFEKEQCLAVQKFVTRKRLLNESSECIYKESRIRRESNIYHSQMTEPAALYLTLPMTKPTTLYLTLPIMEITSSNSYLGSLDRSKIINTSANMMNVSNILNLTSTIPTISHSYNISNILNDSSNEIVEKPITLMTSPYCKQL
ncbi:6146_t:CDS:2, partial [Dentiscutata erythropus]